MKHLEEKDFLKYVIHPRVDFYGGYTYTGEDIDLCDDIIEDENYKCHILQKIREDILISDTEREFKMKNGKTVKETSHQEVELPENQLLIYVPESGFTISEYKMVTIEEAQEMYELIK